MRIASPQEPAIMFCSGAGEKLPLPSTPSSSFFRGIAGVEVQRQVNSFNECCFIHHTAESYSRKMEWESHRSQDKIEALRHYMTTKRTFITS